MDEKLGRYIVNGSHESSKLQDMLDGFIKKFVLCPECDNPETELVRVARYLGPSAHSSEAVMGLLHSQCACSRKYSVLTSMRSIFNRCTYRKLYLDLSLLVISTLFFCYCNYGTNTAQTVQQCNNTFYNIVTIHCTTM